MAKNFLSNGDVMLMFPEERALVVCSEGTGDNLLDEDMEEGYVDYVNLTRYSISLDCGDPELVEVDGGMAMFREYVTDLSDDELVEALKYETGLSPDAAYKVIELA